MGDESDSVVGESGWESGSRGMAQEGGSKEREDAISRGRSRTMMMLMLMECRRGCRLD